MYDFYGKKKIEQILQWSQMLHKFLSPEKLLKRAKETL